MIWFSCTVSIFLEEPTRNLSYANRVGSISNKQKTKHTWMNTFTILPFMPSRNKGIHFQNFRGLPTFTNFPRRSEGKFRGFCEVSGCNRLWTSLKWTIFQGRLPGFSGISGNFRKFSENVGDFPGISGGKFGGFFGFSSYNRL